MSYLISASDDKGSVTLSATGLPSWLSFSAGTFSENRAPDDADVGSSTITVTAADSAGQTASTTFTVTVNDVNEAPSLEFAGSGAASGAMSFTENDGPSVLDNQIQLVDPDPGANATLNVRTVQVQVTGNYANGEDVLQFADTASVRLQPPGFDATSGTIILEAIAPGGASIADFNSALQAIRYNNTSEDPTPAPRTLTLTVTDELGAQQTATHVVNVTAVNDAPVFSAGATLGAVDEDLASPTGSTVAALIGGSFADPAEGDGFAGITIAGNTANAATEGRWQYSTDSGASWNDVGAVDTSTALLLDATAALRFVPALNFNGVPASLTVHAVEDSSPVTFTSGATRQTFDTTADDGTSVVSATGVSIGTSINPVNDAPAVSLSSNTNISFVEDTFGSFVDPGLSLTEVENDLITGATVTISAGFDTGDTLFFDVGLAASFGISETGTAVGVDGSLELTGNATAAQYQQVLRTVEFLSTSDTPTASRTIQIDVTDGTLTTTITRDLDITAVNDAPVLTSGNIADKVFARGGNTVRIDETITLTDVDTTVFDGATLEVVVTANNDADDRLSVFNDGTGAGQIGFDGTTVTYGGTTIGTVAGSNNGSGMTPLEITLNANANTAAVQALIRALSFNNVNGALSDTDDREVSVILSEAGGATPNVFSRTIDVIENSFPTHSANPATLNETEDTPFSIATSTFSNVFQDTDIGDSLQAVRIDTLPAASIGELQLNSVPVTAGQEISLADLDAGLLTFVPVNNANVDIEGSATFTFSVGDGKSFATTPATATIDLAAVNDAPVITIAGATAVHRPGVSAIPVAPSLRFTDVDAATASTAGYLASGYMEIDISSGRTAGDRLSIADQGTGADQVGFDGANVTYEGTIVGTVAPASDGGSTEVLRITFNANATPEAAEAIGQAITYQNIDAAPDNADRTIQFSVHDGTAAGVAVQLATVTVEAGVLADAFNTDDGARGVINSTGQNDYATASSNDFLTEKGAFTWEAWVDPAGNSGTDTILSIGRANFSQSVINTNFSSTPSTLSVSGTPSVTGGTLLLTPETGGAGTATIDPTGAAEGAVNFSASFDLKIGDGTAPAGDGMSFSYGTGTFVGGAAENGITQGLSITFDTYDNGGEDLTQMQVTVNGSVVHTATFPGNTARTEPSTHVADFDGSGDVLVRQGDTALDQSGDVSVEAWINPDSYGGTIIGLGGPSGDGDPDENYSLLLTLESDGRLRVLHEYNSGDNDSETFSPIIPLNAWTHIAVTRDVTDAGGGAGTYRLYLDGVLADTQIFENDPEDASDALLTIGAELDSSNSAFNEFDGQMDDIRIWDDVRTGTEISDNYDKELSTSPSDLVAHYTFDDSLTADSSTVSGSQTLDSSFISGHTADRIANSSGPQTAEFENVSITHDANGLDVSYKGQQIVTDLDIVSQGYSPTESYEYIFGVRSGSVNDRHEVDNLQITANNVGTRYALVVQDGDLAFVEESAAGTTTHNTNTDIFSDGWHHVGARYDGAGNLTLFIDGAPVQTFGGLSIDIDNGQLVLGSASDSSSVDPWSGMIAELRTWTDARTDAEILANFRPNIDADDGNLSGYWKFDAGTGTTVTDASGNGNTITFAGGANQFSHTTSSLFPAPDSTKWVVVEGGDPDTDGDTAYVEDGALVLVNREIVRSANEFDPSAENPIHVTGRFSYQNEDDILTISTRSNATPDANAFGYASESLNFDINDSSGSNSGQLNIFTRSGSANTDLTAIGDALLELNAGAEYDFEVFDDGINVRFIVTEVGNPQNTAEITSTSAFDPGTNYVTVHNREDITSDINAPGSFVSRVSDLRIDQDLSTGEGETISSVLSAPSSMTGPLTFTALDQSDGVFTITDAATGAYTFAPTANFHGQASYSYQVIDANDVSHVENVIINVVPDTDVLVAGQHLVFDGVNDYVEVGRGVGDGLAITDDLTVEGWFNTNTLGSVQRLISFVGDTSSGNADENTLYDVSISADGKIVFTQEDGAGNVTSVTTPQVVMTPGAWAHVAVVRDATTQSITVYIDGIPEATSTYATAPTGGANGQLTFGGAFSGGNIADSLDGRIDDIRIWDTARTEDDIRLNYNQQLPGTEDGLVANYSFDNVQDGIAFDKTANGNDGQLGTATLGDDLEPTTDTATASVTDGPAIYGNELEIVENEPFTGFMVSNESLDGAVSYAVLDNGGGEQTSFTTDNGGLVSINAATGEWTYTPQTNSFGTDTFTLRASGATSGQDDEVITVNISGDSDEASVNVNDGILSVDGTDDHVKSAGTISLTNFTLEAQFRGSENSTIQGIVATDDGTGPYAQIATSGGSDGKLLIEVFDGTNSKFYISSVAPLDGDWHHVAMTYDDTGNGVLRLFIDGIEDTSLDPLSDQATTFSVTDEILVGIERTENTSTGTFTGEIDEVRVWNDVRTPTEVATFQNQQLTGVEDNLQAYYRFDGEAEGTTVDNKATATGAAMDGSLSGDAHIVDIPSTAMRFDGTNDTVRISDITGTDFATDTNSFTYELWMRSETSQLDTIISIGQSAANGAGIALRVEADGTFGINRSTGDNVAELTGGTINDGIWHHVAVVYDADTGITRALVDGEVVAAGDIGTFNIDDGTMRIGAGLGGINDYAGDVADVRLWNVARTDEEIADNLNTVITGNENNTLAVHYTFDDVSSGNAIDTAGDNDAELVDNGSAGLSDDVQQVSTSPNVLGNILEIQENDGASGTFFNNDVPGAAAYDIVGGGAVDSDGYIIAATANGGTVTIDQDTGDWTYNPAENYHGNDSFTLTASGTFTVNGVTTTKTDTEVINVSITPEAEQSSSFTDDNVMSFDGAGTDIVKGSLGTGTLAQTASFQTRVLFQDLANHQNVLRVGNQDVSSDDARWVLEKIDDKFSVFVGNNAGSTQITTDLVLSADTWYDVSVTIDGTITKIYINGDLHGQGTTVTAPLTNVAQAVTVGADREASNLPSKILVDEVKVWDTILTDDQVQDSIGEKAVGNETGLLVYYDFNDEGEDGVVQNLATATGDASDGIIEGNPQFIQSPSKAVSFDGVDDVVTVANPTQLDATGAGEGGTWSFWMKSDGTWATDGADGDDTAIMLGRADAASSTNGLQIGARPNGDLYITAKDSNGANTNQFAASGSNVTDNIWHNVTVVYGKNTGDLIKVYVDGSLVDAFTLTNTWNFNDQDLLFGQSSDDHWEQYEGQLDNVQIYDRKLTDAEVAQIYTSLPQGDEAGLVGFYQFEETGLTATNSSTDANSIGDGTMTGGVARTDASNPIFGNAVVLEEGESASGQMTADDIVLDGGSATFGVTGGNVVGNTSTLTIADKGTITIDTVTGAWEFTPLDNFNTVQGGALTFDLTAVADHGITDTETIAITINQSDNASVIMSDGVLDLDGTSGRVTVPDNSQLDITGDLTMEAWIKPEGAGSNGATGGVILTKELSYELVRFPDGSINFALQGTSGGWSSIDTGYDAPLNTWTHITVVYDSSAREVKTYANGDLVSIKSNAAGDNIPADIAATANPVVIGGRTDNLPGQYFDGQMDEVRVWSEARTALEVRENYDRRIETDEPSLAGAWHFDENPGEGEIENANPNSTLSLDGNGDFVSVASGINIANSSFSVELWVNRDTSNSQDFLVGQGTGTDNQGLHIGYASASELKVGFWNNDLVYTNDGDDVGEWVHWAVTYDATTNKRSLYKNGELVASDIASDDYSGTGALYIGQTFDGNPVDGNMDDVRIWNTVRSADEIINNYQSTLTGDQGGALIGHYTFENGTAADSAGSNDGAFNGDAIATDKLIENGVLSDGAAIVDATGPVITGTTLEVTSGETGALNSATGTMISDDVIGTATYSVQGAASNGSASIDPTTGVWTYTPNADYVGTDSFTLRAAGGGINDDETITVTVTPDDRVNVADSFLQLDGDDGNYVDLGSSGDIYTGTGSFTYEAWVNTSEAGRRQEIVSIGNDALNQSSFFHINANGQLQFDGYAQTGVIDDQVIADGTWHHVAVSYDSSTQLTTLYVDGNETASVTMDPINIVTGAEARIGGQSDNVPGRYFEGGIDDVRIWDDVRTATEIKANYDQQLSGGETDLIGYYTFDDNPANVATVTNHATANAGNDGSIVVNSGNQGFGEAVIDFDGTSDHAIIPVDAGGTFTNGLTFMTWIQVDQLPANGVAGDMITGRYTNGSDDSKKSWSVQLFDSGKLSFGLFGSISVSTDAAVLSAGEWAHIAVAWDNATPKIYINGVEPAQTVTGSHTGAPPNDSSDVDIYLGKFDDPGGSDPRYVDGRMDETSYFNRGLSQAEVQSAMNNGLTGDEADLFAHLTYDNVGGTNNQTVFDKSGNGNDLILGADTSVTTDDPAIIDNNVGVIGHRGDAITLDGTGDQVDLGSPATFAFGAGDFTLETWFRADVTNNTRMSLINIGGTGINDQGAYLFVEDGQLKFDSFSSADIATSKTVNDQTWHHVAMSRSGDLVKLYIDGELAGSGNLTFTVLQGQSELGEAMNGEMADVRIWDTARTDKEIADNYNQTLSGNHGGALVANYKFDEAGGPVVINNANPGTVDGILAGDATRVDAAPDLFGNAITIDEDTNASGVFDITGASGFTVSNAASHGTVIIDGNGAWVYTPNANFYGTDTFTLSATGVDTETITVTVNEIEDGASVDVNQAVLSLDGTGDFVNLPDTILDASEGTVSLTANLAAGADTNELHFAFANRDSLGNGGDRVYIFFEHDGTDWHIKARLDTVEIDGGVVDPNTWVDASIVWRTDGTGEFFVDGDSKGETSGLTFTNDIQTLVNIGSYDDGGSNFFHGMIDEVSVWSIAQTGDEIRDTRGTQLAANEVGLTAYYTFENEKGDEVIRDQTNNNNDGTLEADATTTADDLQVLGNGVEINTTETAAGTMTSADIELTNASFGVWNGLASVTSFTTDNGGTVTINASTGDWTYDPATNFIGEDTFTLRASSTNNTVTLTDDQVISVAVHSDDSINVASGAFNLDGSNDYAQITANASLNLSNNFTLEAWIMTTGNGNQYIIANDNTGSDVTGGYNFGVYSGTGLFYETNNTNGSQIVTDVLTVGEWHHVAVTFDDSADPKMTFFVDGDDVGTGDPTAPSATGTNVLIGRRGFSNSSDFKGMIDDVRIWDETRTPAEIETHFDQQLKGDESGLQAYLRFDETGTTVTDHSQNSNVATIENGNIVNSLGRALDFDGSTTFIDAGRGAGDSLAIAGDVTVETWFKLDQISGKHTIVDFANSNDASVDNVLYQLQVRSDGDIEYSHEDGNGVNSDLIVFDTNLAAGDWHHISMSRDVSAKTVKLYLDGQLFGTQTYSGNNPDGGSSSTLAIGASVAGAVFGDNKLDGQMSDLRIWSTARTDQEIADNYNQTLSGDQGGALQLNYRFDELDGSTVSDSSGTQTDATVTGSANFVEASPTILADVEAAESTIIINEDQTASGYMVDHIPGIADFVAGTPSNGSVVIDSTTGAWTYTPAENFNGTDTFTLSARDTGGNILDTDTVRVTINPVDDGNATFAGGSALQFDPATDFVEIGRGSSDELAITGDLTVEGWINIQALTGATQELLSFSGAAVDSDGTNNALYQLVVDNSGTLTYFHEDGNGTNTEVNASAPLTVGEWAHVAVVRDATAKTVTMYVNGNTIGTTYNSGENGSTGTYTNDPDGGASSILTLGGNLTGSSDALMNEVRIWDAARTSDEIRANYDKQISNPTGEADLQGYWNADATDGRTINDLSSNGNDGLLGGGKVLSLDGTGDYVSVADDNAFDFDASQSFTLETWVNLNDVVSPQSLIDKSEAAADVGNYRFYIHNGQFNIWPVDGSGVGTVAGATVEVNEWTHLAVSFDAVNDTITFYKNGRDVGEISATHVGANFTTDGPLFIGRDQQGRYVNGEMDEVRIWNDVRTPSEINEFINSPLAGNEAGLVANYSFDADNAGSTVTDNSANGFDASLHGDASVISDITSHIDTFANAPDVMNTLGSAYKFTNPGDHVEVAATGDLAFGTNDFSIETWIKLDQVGVNQSVIDNRGASNLQGVLLGVNASDKVTFGFSDGADGTTISGSGTTTLEIGKWYHVAVSVDRDGNANLYVNGSADRAPIDVSGETSNIGTTAWQIGRESAVSGTAFGQFQGELSDVRFWNDVRSGNQIATNYNKTFTGDQGGALVAHFPLNEITASNKAQDTAGDHDGDVTGALAVSSGPGILVTSLSIEENSVASGQMTAAEVGGVVTYSLADAGAVVDNTEGITTYTDANVGTTIIDHSSGHWTFTPAENYHGTANFTLTATGNGATDTQPVTVTVGSTDVASASIPGSALQLDGSVGAQLQADLGTGTFGDKITIEFKVNFNDITGAQQNLFGLWDTGNKSVLNPYLQAGGTGKLVFNVDDQDTGGVQGINLEAGVTIAADTWYDVAMVLDGTTARIYVDGDQVAEGDLASPVLFDAANLHKLVIGGNPVGDADFAPGVDTRADLDDVRIWNTARTSEQIRDNHDQQLTGKEVGLQAYYTFDEPFGGTVEDQTSNGFNASVPRKAITLDGSGDYIQVPDDAVDSISAGTIETWIYLDSNTGETIFAKQHDTVNSYAVFGVGYVGSTGGGPVVGDPGVLTFRSSNDNPTNGNAIESNGRLATGQWHHVAVTFTTNEANLYINGQLDNTVTGVDFSIPNDTNANVDARIGSWAGQGQDLNGKIDDFRVWNDVRTQAEIEANMNKVLVGDEAGLHIYYDFDREIDGSSGSIDNKAATTGSTLADGTYDGTRAGNATVGQDDTSPVTNEGVSQASSSAEVFGNTITIEQGDTASGVMTGNDVVGSSVGYDITGQPSNGTVTVHPTTGAWTYTPNDNYSGTDTFTVRASGGGLTDSETITVTINEDNDINLHGGAIQFDGVNDIATVAHDDSLNMSATGFTLELWVNAEGSESAAGILDKMDQPDGTVSPPYNGWKLNVSSAGGSASFWVGDDVSDTDITHTTSIVDGAWHHVAVVYDPTAQNIEMYIDGNATGSPTDVSGLTASEFTNTADLLFGNDSLNVNPFFHGMIDDVRIWSEPRSTQEIADNFDKALTGNETNLEAYWKFDALEGNVVQDVTGNGHDAQIANDTQVPVTGNVLTLGGTGDYVEMNYADVEAIDLTAGTIETWVKLDDETKGTIFAQQHGFTNSYAVFMVGNNPVDINNTTVANDGKLFFRPQNAVNTPIESTSTLTPGQWHHVAVTFDGTGATLYIDGVADATVAGTNFSVPADPNVNSPTGTQAARIGDFDGAAGQELDGQLSNFRIWSEVRTAEEIREGMAQSYDYDTGNLEIQYTFDDVSGSTVSDGTFSMSNDTRSGNIDGTLNGNASVTASGNGQAQILNFLDHSIQVDGNGDYVSVGTDTTAISGTAARTFMVWAKTTDNGTQNLFSIDGTGSKGSQFNFGINGWSDVGGGTGITLDVGSGGISFAPVSSTADGNWHHYAVVVPGGGSPSLRDVQVYQDGILLETISALYNNEDVAINTNDNDALKISQDGTRAFNGELAEASVWSSALTGAEIKTYMSTQLAGDETDLQGYWRGDTNAAGDVIDHSANGNDGTLNGDATVVDVAPDIQSNTMQIVEDTIATGRMTGADVTGTASFSAPAAATNGTVTIDSTTGVWNYTPNAGFAGTDTFTLRAIGTDGTTDDEVVSVRVGTDPVAPHQYALTFDGDDDYVDLGTVDNIVGAFSAEAWVKFDNFFDGGEAGWSRIFDIGDGTGGGNTNGFLVTATATTGELALYTYNGGTTSSITATSALPLNEWTHIAAVNDGAGSASLYVNGSVVASTNSGFQQALPGMAFESSYIGRSTNTNDSYFNGQIADARIWDTARNSIEIANNYDRQLNGDEDGLAGYWTFNEGAGSMATDISGNGNDGAIIGATHTDLTTITDAPASGQTYKGLVLGADADGSSLSYALNTAGDGAVTVDTDGSFDYTSTGADDSFTVDITDDDNNTTTHTVNIDH